MLNIKVTKETWNSAQALLVSKGYKWATGKKYLSFREGAKYLVARNGTMYFGTTAWDAYSNCKELKLRSRWI